METKFFKTFEDLILYLWDLHLKSSEIGIISFVLSKSNYFYGRLVLSRSYHFWNYEIEIIKLESGSMVYPIQSNVKKIDKI